MSTQTESDEHGDYYDARAANVAFLREAMEYARNAALKADDEYSAELERCYGAARRGDARYMYRHSDPGCQRAAEAKLEADRQWIETRDALQQALYGD